MIAVDLVLRKPGEIVDLRGDVVRSIIFAADRCKVKNGTADGQFQVLYPVRAQGPAKCETEGLVVKRGLSKCALIRNLHDEGSRWEMEGDCQDGPFGEFDPLTDEINVELANGAIVRTGPVSDLAMHSDCAQSVGGKTFILRRMLLEARWMPTGWIGNSGFFARPKLRSVQDHRMIECDVRGAAYGIAVQRAAGDPGVVAPGGIRVAGNNFTAQKYGKWNVALASRANNYAADNPPWTTPSPWPPTVQQAA